MLVLQNPATDAMVYIRDGDMEAVAIFEQLVLDGYKPIGKRAEKLAVKIIDLDVEKQSALHPKE